MNKDNKNTARKSMYQTRLQILVGAISKKVDEGKPMDTILDECRPALKSLIKATMLTKKLDKKN